MLRKAKQTPMPMVKSPPQSHLHARLPRLRKHYRTCLNHKSRIAIFEELNAPPARKQSLTSVRRRQHLIQKALLVKIRRYREKGPYPDPRSARPVRRQDQINVRGRVLLLVALIVKRMRFRAGSSGLERGRVPSARALLQSRKNTTMLVMT